MTTMAFEADRDLSYLNAVLDRGIAYGELEQRYREIAQRQTELERQVEDVQTAIAALQRQILAKEGFP